jgi:hypothetical protein
MYRDPFGEVRTDTSGTFLDSVLTNMDAFLNINNVNFLRNAYRSMGCVIMRKVWNLYTQFLTVLIYRYYIVLQAITRFLRNLLL